MINKVKQKKAFSSIPIPERTEKPREVGISMIIDWGMGLLLQRDSIEGSSEYIDLAKVAAGISRLYPVDYLKKKIELYRKYDIEPFPGGLFFELAYKQGTWEKFIEEALDVGYRTIEVSDNLLDIEPEEKHRVIRRVVEEMGVEVYGEVGKKEGAGADDDALLEDIEGCLTAGAKHVFVEAVELFVGRFNESLIEAIFKRFPLKSIIIELPVLILPGTHHHDIYEITSKLISRLGPDINLANIYPTDIWIIELLRRGMAGDTSNPWGAYRLAGFEDKSRKQK